MYIKYKYKIICWDSTLHSKNIIKDEVGRVGGRESVHLGLTKLLLTPLFIAVSLNLSPAISNVVQCEAPTQDNITQARNMVMQVIHIFYFNI